MARTGGCYQSPAVVIMGTSLHIPNFQTANAPSSPHAAIPQVVVMVVMMVVMVHHVMNRYGSLPGRLSPPPLVLAPLRFQGRGRRSNVEASATSHDPADVCHLLGPLADDVDQVLEQLIVAGSRLREGGQGAGIGHEAHSLLLHKLTLPLLGL